MFCLLSRSLPDPGVPLPTRSPLALLHPDIRLTVGELAAAPQAIPAVPGGGKEPEPTLLAGEVQIPDVSGYRGAGALPGHDRSSPRRRRCRGRGEGRWRRGGGVRRGGQGGRAEPARRLCLGCGMGRQ